MAIAKVFKSGNSQALRLPKEFRLDVEEVEITRQGTSLLVTPVTRVFGDWLVDLLNELDLDRPEDTAAAPSLSVPLFGAPARNRRPKL